MRLVEIGGPLELELVDWRPGACRAHSAELALCHNEGQPHVAEEVMVVATEVLPFWSCFL